MEDEEMWVKMYKYELHCYYTELKIKKKKNKQKALTRKQCGKI